MSKVEKAVKLLGEEVVAEMEAMDEVTLRKRVVEANEAMRQVDEELEANEKYQECKENLKALTAGKKEVDKRQKAVIVLSLQLIRGDKRC